MAVQTALASPIIDDTTRSAGLLAFPGNNPFLQNAFMPQPAIVSRLSVGADNDDQTDQITARRPFEVASPEITSEENDPRNTINRLNPFLWLMMEEMNKRINSGGTANTDTSPEFTRHVMNEALNSLEQAGIITPDFRNSINRMVGTSGGLAEFSNDFHSFREGGMFNGPQRGTTVSEAEMERIARRSPADREGDLRVIAVQTGVGRGGRALGTMAIVDHNGNVVRDPQTGQPAMYDFVSGIRSHGRGGAMPGFNGGDFFGSGNDGINAVWTLNSPVYNHRNPRIDGFFMHVTGYESRTGRSEIGIHRSVSVGNGDVYDRGGSMGCPVMNAQDTASFARVVSGAGNLRPDMIIVADRGGPSPNMA